MNMECSSRNPGSTTTAWGPSAVPFAKVRCPLAQVVTARLEVPLNVAEISPFSMMRIAPLGLQLGTYPLPGQAVG